MAGQTCDVCGSSDHFAGVASAAGPISVAWCSVCLAMEAQPDFVIMVNEDMIIDPEAPYADYIPALKAQTGAMYFDLETCSYWHGGVQHPIKLKDGRVFNRRDEVPEVLG